VWVLDASGMRDVVCRIRLPQRVPYGLHGNFFSENMISNQRDVEKFRNVPVLEEKTGAWNRVRNWSIGVLG